jgi:hypothetical protein
LPTVAETELINVEKWARIGSDDDDIAALLRVPLAFLEVYRTEIEYARAERRAIILSTVWQSAKEGKTNLLIWLGKVELGWAERAKRGKISHRPKPTEPCNLDAFIAEFNSILVDGKPPDESTLRRFAMMSMRDELESPKKQPAFVDSCIISTPSPASSSNEPSSTTAGSPSTQRPSRPPS